MKVLRVIGTGTAEEHDGYRTDLAMPGIRRHDNLQEVCDYDIETCERPSLPEITVLLWYPLTVSVTWGSGEHLQWTALIGLTRIE